MVCVRYPGTSSASGTHLKGSLIPYSSRSNIQGEAEGPSRLPPCQQKSPSRVRDETKVAGRNVENSVSFLNDMLLLVVAGFLTYLASLIFDCL